MGYIWSTCPSPKIATPHRTSSIDANYMGVLIRLLDMNVLAVVYCLAEIYEHVV
jgi:hypothetical protein